MFGRRLLRNPLYDRRSGPRKKKKTGDQPVYGPNECSTLFNSRCVEAVLARREISITQCIHDPPEVRKPHLYPNFASFEP